MSALIDFHEFLTKLLNALMFAIRFHQVCIVQLVSQYQRSICKIPI